MTHDNRDLAVAVADVRTALLETHDLLDRAEALLLDLPSHPSVREAAARAHQILQDTRRLTVDASVHILGWTE